MCGIAGAVVRPGSPFEASVLTSMLDSMAHRGPDGQGIYRAECTTTSGRVFLGHRRLAIIDPHGARQPMCNAAAGLALTFNGEIYNFRELREQLRAAGYEFHLDSDTEVLLRAYEHWQEDVVNHLRGMFAFAIWDSRRQRMFLARDRFGEKPLFLLENANGFFFASEIKALLRIPGVRAEVNLEAASEYLAYRYVPGPKTLFCGIRKLMPGTSATYERGSLREKRYWTSPDRVAHAALASDADAVPAFLGKLDEAVRLQMVSDVPFGAFLSGGLDSSTIVALMSRHSSNVNTFSVGFGESRYSELAFAEEVAHCFGARHHPIEVSHQDIVQWLPKLVAFRDAPVSEPSDIPIHLLAREASRSVKMVLTGEGSDEILGGYPKHVMERFAAGYQVLPGFLRNGLIAPLVNALPYGFRRVKTAMTNLNTEDWRERYVRWFGALNRAERDSISLLHVNGKGAHVGVSSSNTSIPPFDSEPDNSDLRRMLYFDQTSWLPDNLLERGDRMTMAASIESRVPFLDHELAAFVSKLPDNQRVRGFRSKWILREVARKLIPQRILNRPKVGFRVPVNQWFRGQMKEYLLDHLQSSSSRTRAYYDARALDNVLRQHMEGRQNHEKLLWTMLNLEIWQRQYV